MASSDSASSSIPKQPPKLKALWWYGCIYV